MPKFYDVTIKPDGEWFPAVELEIGEFAEVHPGNERCPGHVVLLGSYVLISITDPMLVFDTPLTVEFSVRRITTDLVLSPKAAKND